MTIINRDILTSARISIEAKGLYAYLATYAGKPFPSMDRIAAEMGNENRDYLKYLLYELQANGILEPAGDGSTYVIVDWR